MSFLLKTLNPDLIKKHTKTVMLIWILFILGQVSAIMFVIFLFKGSFTIIYLGLGSRDVLLIDAFLSITFFLQHSIMVRRGFKQWLGKFMPNIYHNAFYGLTSVIAIGIGFLAEISHFHSESQWDDFLAPSHFIFSLPSWIFLGL